MSAAKEARLTAPITVLKLGGSVLRDEAALSLAVHEVYRELRAGRRVVAVVSALGGVTDRLAARARSLTPDPPAAALAALLATGELQSAALLTLALDRAGIAARALDVDRCRLVAEGPPLDAAPIDLDLAPILEALQQHSVLVVPGFIARNRAGERVLLGRGGSDLTALLIGARLQALAQRSPHDVEPAELRTRLVKDVPGLFDRDPARLGRQPQLYRTISWDDALQLDGRIVQHKAIRFAREERFSFEVAGVNREGGTLVGAGPSRFAIDPNLDRPPLRVALLGLGNVGLGVWRRLVEQPERFRLIGAAVRRLRPAIDAGVPIDLLTTNSEELIDGRFGGEVDMVVEALGGLDPALSLVTRALRQGCHVVTANKELLAFHGAELQQIAAARGVTLIGSAAVGGGVPMLETIAALRRRHRIVSIRAVLNGSSNFVLDRLALGESLDRAVRRAQAAGFAEQDPSRDLDGSDAALKLMLLARAAFGIELPFDSIERGGIDAALEAGASARTAPLRSVARLTESTASIAIEPLDADDLLAGLVGEENGIAIELGDGMTQVWRGRGAGRYPTAESIVGDLWELARRSASSARSAASVPTAEPANWHSVD